MTLPNRTQMTATTDQMITWINHPDTWQLPGQNGRVEFLQLSKKRQSLLLTHLDIFRPFNVVGILLTKRYL